MTYKLFLDDYRHPSQVTWQMMPEGPFVLVKTYQEFVDYITANGLPSYVSFDHDLADLHYLGKYVTEKTGNECAQWLVDYCRERGVALPTWQIHSMNPVGKQRIHATLTNYDFHHMAGS